MITKLLRRDSLGRAIHPLQTLARERNRCLGQFGMAIACLQSMLYLPWLTPTMKEKIRYMIANLSNLSYEFKINYNAEKEQLKRRTIK